jgi:hypothetical protein
VGKGLGENIRDSREVGVKALSENAHTGELKMIDGLEQDQTVNWTSFWAWIRLKC